MGGVREEQEGRQRWSAFDESGGEAVADGFGDAAEFAVHFCPAFVSQVL